MKRKFLVPKNCSTTLSSERESDQPNQEVEDLNYRITNLQHEFEDVSRGPRPQAKNERRRRLQRDLVKLEHEELPELERKLRDCEARREKEKREWHRAETKGTNDSAGLQGTNGTMNVNASAIGSGRTEMRTKIAIVKGKGKGCTEMTTGIAAVTAM